MRTNWSGHVTFGAARYAEPSSEADLQSLVRSERHVHAVGTGHSFNEIADTDGVHVSVARLPGHVEIDTDARIARVPAGMRFGEVARVLDERGWAVANLASLGHISVAGTVATGTHGSGDRNTTLSALVRGLRVVRADGSVEDVDEPASLDGQVVGLGALGVVTRVDLSIVPRFEVAQYVFDDVSRGALADSFAAVFGAAHSVSYFTTWDSSRTGQVWMKRRLDADAAPGDRLLDGRAATEKRNPVPGADPRNATEQFGAPGAWHDRLPHFRLDHTPSSGDELQTEYLVPRDEAVTALRELEQLAPRMHELLLVSEIRTMTADRLWLSGAFGRDTVGFHFTWQRRPEVLDLLPELDLLLGPRGGRPHWGKLFAVAAADLRARYPRFDDFAALAAELDPHRTFRNRLLDWLLDAD